jgi:hypothetical protein
MKQVLMDILKKLFQSNLLGVQIPNEFLKWESLECKTYVCGGKYNILVGDLVGLQKSDFYTKKLCVW